MLFHVGLERYIVFIANIRSSHDVTVNSFLFEMRNGEQLPVMKGSFEELQGESPFRLNSDVMKTVRVGAESLREVKHVHEFEKKSPRRKDTKPESQGDTGTQKEKEMATRSARSIESDNSKTEGRKDNSEHDESSREIYSNNDNNKDSSTKVDTVTANNSNNDTFEIGLPSYNHKKEEATISKGEKTVKTQLTSNEEPSTPPTNTNTPTTCSTTTTNTTTTTDNSETGVGPQKPDAPKVDTVAANNSNNDNSNIPTTNTNTTNTPTTNESGTKQGPQKPDAPTKEGQREDSKDSFSNAAESTSLQTQSNNEDSSNSPQQDATTEQHSTTANKSENVNPNYNHKDEQAPISEGDKTVTTQPKTSHSSGEHPLDNDSSEQRNRKTPGLLDMCCFYLCRSNR